MLILRGEFVVTASWWRTLKSRIKRRRAAVDMVAGRCWSGYWESEAGAGARWYRVAVYVAVRVAVVLVMRASMQVGPSTVGHSACGGERHFTCVGET